jgi:diaminopimelate epimerase
MKVTFTKLHGSANDYLYVNCLEQPLENAPAVARILSDRHRGVGSDGLILVCPSDSADFRMEMYNADGSRGDMCGNGIRAFAKYVADRDLTKSDNLSVDTDAGIKTLDLHKTDGLVTSATVNMGAPILEGRDIPVAADGRVIDQPLEVDGRSWNVTCVSMGNPHCVTFDEDPDPLQLQLIGPPFENHPFFPKRVNTEFVRVDSRTHLTMRVWERGSGETMACGTGACAVLVAAVLTGRADRAATVSLLGGDLEIEYREDESVMMTGPAEEVFTSSVEVDPVAGTFS